MTKSWQCLSSMTQREEREKNAQDKWFLSFLFSSFSLPVMDLVYWRSTRRTGLVFTGLVVGLASVFQLSIITVASHVCLGALCVTFPLRLYYKLLELLRWNPGVHPFQSVNTDYPSSTLAFVMAHNWCCGAIFCGWHLCWCVCVCVHRSYLDNDPSMTDKETVMLVEEVVLLIAFAVAELKRLIFIDSIVDSIKVWMWWWKNRNLCVRQKKGEKKEL